ncbi:unnamed protein product [Cuscuta campestris]|uniref:CCHC-type domain-containing protein n=1 Tax=Cuscuta campestris TaxID=132261 RepID=A0A484KZJ0_9ASTE|nr:unnamed protein product [Cuscuta campestris]
MWTKLEVTYEGTSQVKDAKVDLLLHEYELFSMKANESIDSYFERFSNIINNLDTLGKHYTDHDLVRKILRCMTPEWKSEVRAISEGRDYNTLTYDTLRGKLLTYETYTLYPPVDSKQRKSIALKSTKEIEEVSHDEDSSDTEENPELALVIKRFNKFVKKNFKPRKDNSKKSTPPKCYECGEVGHIKPYCPKLKQEKEKKFKKKQKAYISWDNSGSSSETSNDEEETANLCLMALEDEVCLKASSVLWYLDSGCSKHMTGDASKFIFLKSLDGGNVIFGDNNKGKIIGTGTVGKDKESGIDNVLLVKGLKHNLLSISQLCDKGNRVTFTSSHCLVERLCDKKIILTGDRINNIYMINLDSTSSDFAHCLMTREEEMWLWHKRIGSLEKIHLEEGKSSKAKSEKQEEEVKEKVTISSGELNEMFGMENSNKELTTQNNDQNPWYNFDEEKCWEVMNFKPSFNESGRPKVSGMQPPQRLIQYIASYILRGRSGNHPQMSRDDAMLIYAILKPVSVNWGKYILSYMNLCRAKKKALPYPMLLTFLLKTKGFEFLSTESDSETAFWRIKRATVMRVKIDTEEEHEEAGPSHSRVASRSNKVTLPMLFESLQSLQTSFNNIQLQQATYGYNLNKMLVKSGEQWETPSMEALAPYMSQGSSSQAASFDDESDDVDEDDDDAEKEDADHLDATMDEE